MSSALDLHPWLFLLIFATGVFAGFLNTVAGGGSLLTLPVLIFAGLPAAVANGTNRVAIFFQNVSAVESFRRKGVHDFRYGAWIAVPAVVGSLLGASIAIDINEELFNRVLAVVMLLALGFILFGKKADAGTQGRAWNDLSVFQRAWSVPVFFLVGVYGGFIQAGVGFLILTALTAIPNFGLVRANAVKVFVVLAYTVAALFMFASHAKVDWLAGIVLATGNATGGWIGGHFAVSKGQKWIRLVLAVAVVAFSIKLLLTGE